MANKADWYRITMNAATKSADVYLYGVVGGYDWENDKFLDGAGFVSELNALDVDVINFRINSPGGSVAEGHAIHNALIRHKAQVITHVDALAASMASVIAMAGDEVHMAENATMMIHDPWSIVMGDSDELRKYADILDMMGEQIISGYQRHSNLDAADIRAMMSDETWMNADTAMEHGFATHIDGAMQIAANISDKLTFSKMPDAIRPNQTKDKAMPKDTPTIDPEALKVAVDAALEDITAENTGLVAQVAERDATIAALTTEAESLTAQATAATEKLEAETTAHEAAKGRLAALTGGLKQNPDNDEPKGDAVAAFNAACADVVDDRKCTQVVAVHAVMKEQPQVYAAYIESVNHRD